MWFGPGAAVEVLRCSWILEAELARLADGWDACNERALGLSNKKSGIAVTKREKTGGAGGGQLLRVFGAY